MVRLIWRFGIVLIVAGASGCVSSTLESSQFRPVGAKSSNTLSAASLAAQDQTAPVDLNGGSTSAVNADGSPVDPRATTDEGRRQGIEQIRTKAQTSSGQKTQFGALPEVAAEQLTPEQQRAKSQALATEAAQANGTVGAAEVESKQESIRRLRAKATSHYKDALNKIEN